MRKEISQKIYFVSNACLIVVLLIVSYGFIFSTLNITHWEEQMDLKRPYELKNEESDLECFGKYMLQVSFAIALSGLITNKNMLKLGLF